MIHTFAISMRTQTSWPLPPSPTPLLVFMNRTNPRSTFALSNLSGLESELPTETQSHLIMPFFAHDQPLFVVMAISNNPSISQAAVNIIRSVGSVLLAKAIQSRVMEADAAKTAFLSSISHELRTPMHSIMTGLDIIKSSAREGDWETVESLIGAVEASGLALHNILNDVLDFGKGYASQPGDRKSSSVDLLGLARDAAGMCLAQYEDLESGSGLYLEYEQRDWRVEVDKARYHR